MTKRVMIYGASVAPGGVTTFTTQISTTLHQIMPDLGWQLSVLGKSTNSLKQPLNWPESAFKALNEHQARESESAYSNADVREFQQLVDQDNQPFDLLYLPSPWGNLPLGSTLPIPAPVVMSIHDLEFEEADYGIITDQHRREADKFAKLGSAFVFSSEYVRERAINLYHFPHERTFVIHQAPTVLHVSEDTKTYIRQKYSLPERFAFSLRWLSRRKNGGTIIEALGILKAQGLPSLPLVTAGYDFDDVLPYNVAHQRHGEQIQVRIRELGLDNVIPLGTVEDADIPALIAAASVVIAPSLSESGLSYLMLNAMALGTPLIHSRIPAVTERLGTDNSYALSFDPNDSAELAAQITDILNNEAATRIRSEKAQAFIDQRSQEDVAREYVDIFKSVSKSPWKTRPHQRNHVMRSREERVAWLINHTTLRDAELPIIRQFGMEIYTSKELPAGNEYRTASVDFSEDEHSTLPNWVLDRLNKHNFYEDGVPFEIAELLNGYFGTVIATSFFPPIRDLVQVYKGRILIQVFGREQPHNYSEFFTYMSQGQLWKYVWEAQNRFWFVPGYDSITPIEEKLLRDRTVMLPLALPDRILRAANRWIGNDKRILFICPRIGSVPHYYGAFYREFKQHLGHLPHLIGGHQPIPVDDPTVTGFVSDDQMQSWFRELRVMFYHSREPRHLHYHPLEAVAYGMPLIYMKGGLVEALMGVGKPGACDSYEEAEQKLRRILDGDEAFTQEVIDSQSTLLDTFRPEYVSEVWKDRFYNGIMNISPVPDVLPLPQWKPISSSIIEPIKPPITSKRRIGVYALVAPGGGIYKYVSGLVHAAVKVVASLDWKIDLIWGSPTIGTDGYAMPKWEYLASPLLRVLPVLQPNAIQRLWMQRGKKNQQLWRTSSVYLRYRLIRILSEIVLIPSQYTISAVQQRTLRPQNPHLRAAFTTSRIGRRLLNNRITRRLGVTPHTQAGLGDLNYLTHPPEWDKPTPLIEIPFSQFQPYLTLKQIKELGQKYDALLFGNPFRLVSPNTPLDQIKQQPVAITMYDLAHEFTETWGINAASVSREMVIWGRLAQKIVFGSEYIRNEAVKRYGIPKSNTRVVGQPPMVIRRTVPDTDEISRVKSKLNLPNRYLFNTGHQGTHKNNIAIFQALNILRWRGFDVPPFVIGGSDARRYLLDESTSEYASALQHVIRDGKFIIGSEIIILDYIDEADLPAVYAGASLGISMSRSEMAVHGMITESMLYRTPIIATTIPQNVEELGINDEFALLVPPDDPVALADAIEYTLNNTQETMARVERAAGYIANKTWEKMATEFIEIFEEIATSRAEI